MFSGIETVTRCTQKGFAWPQFFRRVMNWGPTGGTPSNNDSGSIPEKKDKAGGGKNSRGPRPRRHTFCKNKEKVFEIVGSAISVLVVGGEEKDSKSVMILFSI